MALFQLGVTVNQHALLTIHWSIFSISRANNSLYPLYIEVLYKKWYFVVLQYTIWRPKVVVLNKALWQTAMHATPAPYRLQPSLVSLPPVNRTSCAPLTENNQINIKIYNIKCSLIVIDGFFLDKNNKELPLLLSYTWHLLLMVPYWICHQIRWCGSPLILSNFYFSVYPRGLDLRHSQPTHTVSFQLNNYTNNSLCPCTVPPFVLFAL